MSRKPKKVDAPGKTASITPRATGWDNRRVVLGVCIFLIALVWAVFGQTLHHGFFIYDDNVYVFENSAVAGGLSWEGVAAMFSHFECHFYHPLTMLSLMLNDQLNGVQPGGYHLGNVLLHTSSVVLLFLILRRMTGSIWRSGFVAAVFAIHPLRVESVAWVAERKDVLSGFFFMLTIWAYLRYAKKRLQAESPRRAALDYGLVLLFFAMGLLSKSSIVTLPFVLLLLDYWPLDRFGGGTAGSGKRAARREDFSVLVRLVVEKIPLFVLSAAASVATVLAEGADAAPTKGTPLIDRIGNPFVSYVTYIKRMFYPEGLAPIYTIPTGNLPVWKIILAFILLAGVSAAALAQWRKRPYLLVGWLWFLGMLVPMIGILGLGNVPSDRFTYLSQIGLYVLLTWAVADLCAGWRYHRAVLAAAAGIILAALIYCARVQTAYWRDSVTLLTHTLACTSDNYFAHNVLGAALIKKGEVNDAIAQFQQSLLIKPDFADAHNNLGSALMQKGEVDEAIAQYRLALQTRPDFVVARTYLGIALLQKGEVDEAIAQCQQALQSKPDYTDALIVLGNALVRKGRVDEAIAQYQQALQINPNYAEVHFSIGGALLQKGSLEQAIAQYQQALQIKPNYPNAQNVLAWILATAPQASLRDGQKAVELAQQANGFAHGQNPFFLRTLAAAYAEAGQFDAAVQSAQTAMDIAQGAGLADLVAGLTAELKRYKAGLPFHQDSR